MTTVGVQLDIAEGSPSAFLLYLYDEGTLINAGGDTLTEVDNGYFEATVAETLTSTISYEARITKDGNLFYTGWLLPGRSLTVDDPGIGTSELEDKVNSLLSIVQGGDGSFLIELTIKLANGTVVPDTKTTVTTSSISPRTGIVTSGTSLAGGIISFYLDPGVYYIWRQKIGVNFTNPKILTVSSEGVGTIS